jgi:tetratricopeptide (TPR) repeat protein
MTTSRLHHIQEMLSKEPNDSFLQYALALEYANAKDIEKAISIIEGLLLKNENYLGAYYQLGKYYEQTAQQDKAIASYKKGVLIAQAQKNRKTEGELNEALMLLEE